MVAIYSSFLQRAYDQIIEDVCLQNLNVVFAIDRAGVVGADGETHHGIFDLAYLTSMMFVMMGTVLHPIFLTFFRKAAPVLSIARMRI